MCLSFLFKVLKDSFVGENSRTCMVCDVAGRNYDATAILEFPLGNEMCGEWEGVE